MRQSDIIGGGDNYVDSYFEFFVFFMNRSPMGPSLTLNNFVFWIKIYSNPAPRNQENMLQPACSRLVGQRSTLYRQMPRTIHNLASWRHKKSSWTSISLYGLWVQISMYSRVEGTGCTPHLGSFITEIDWRGEKGCLLILLNNSWEKVDSSILSLSLES